jgi:hypothetical protein
MKITCHYCAPHKSHTLFPDIQRPSTKHNTYDNILWSSERAEISILGSNMQDNELRTS